MTPQPDWALDFFGGHNPYRDFKDASNIIFSNGELDPWHAGGVTYNVSNATIALVIKDSAHHLDLRLPNPLDPTSLAEARMIETATITNWITEYNALLPPPMHSVSSEVASTIDLIHEQEVAFLM